MFQSFGFFYRKQAVASIRMASRKARRRTGGGAIKVSILGVESLPSSCIDPNGEPRGAAAHRWRRS